MVNFKGKGILKLLPILLLAALVFSCVRPQYQTSKGKKKNKKYNSVQYAKPAGRVNNARNTGKH